jgi:hypothetical protein
MSNQEDDNVVIDIDDDEGDSFLNIFLGRNRL